MDEIIETPDIFTPIHQEELIQNGELVPFSEELSRKIGLNFNWLIDAKPIGSIIFVNTEQSSVEAINLIPSTSAWQECNGGEITHPNSPLRSIGEQRNYTPNPAGRYIRVSSDL
nr:hypothetical protein [Gammaproteobacteria bacterium]